MIENQDKSRLSMCLKCNYLAFNRCTWTGDGCFYGGKKIVAPFKVKE